MKVTVWLPRMEQQEHQQRDEFGGERPEYLGVYQTARLCIGCQGWVIFSSWDLKSRIVY